MVYRDCEVDRPARPRGGEPRLDFRSTGATPRAGCYVAEFQFIVDTVGAVEMNSVRPKATNDRDLEDAVTPVLSTIRFEPALLDKHPVRQLVLYKRTVGVVVRVLSSSSGSAPPPAGASRPPRCR